MFKHAAILILTLVFCTTQVSTKIVEIKCPPHCRCDWFEDYKRVSCVNQKLIVLESYLPRQTELLELSYNQISHLEDHIFFDENLLSLKLLNISHNKISQIHMNAFEGLNDLKTLDLSYNAMQYVLPHWFWSLKSLQELYLRGNSFGKFNDGPVLESNSLKVLDISKCGVSHIGYDAFTKISNLETLDISENYLIQLDVAVIKPLPNLTVLDVHNNSLSCNGLTSDLSKYCVQKGIRYQDPCKKRTAIKNATMFERMMELPKAEDEKNSWIYDDGGESFSTPPQVTACNGTVTRNDSSLLMNIINLSPTLSILVPFVYGIAVGIVIGCSVQIRPLGGKRGRLQDNFGSSDNLSEGHLRRFDDVTVDVSIRQLRRSHSLFTRKPTSEARESLMLEEWNVSESTPMTQRKFQPVV